MIVTLLPISIMFTWREAWKACRIDSAMHSETWERK
ncbi:hypothetical protein JOE21_001866 [Desmospora profundinema]|uniref:Uncharacterized protein n=1 Tax=Desmospora profundinema TaxID=1571184 RepID=A0ABU1IM47_9BACL|nr:hypothetical protein [Desmospora profundinema]